MVLGKRCLCGGGLRQYYVVTVVASMPGRSSWTSNFCPDFLSCLSRSSFFYYFHIEFEALLHKRNFLQHLLIFLDREI